MNFHLTSALLALLLNFRYLIFFIFIGPIDWLYPFLRTLRMDESLLYFPRLLNFDYTFYVDHLAFNPPNSISNAPFFGDLLLTNFTNNSDPVAFSFFILFFRLLFSYFIILVLRRLFHKLVPVQDNKNLSTSSILFILFFALSFYIFNIFTVLNADSITNPLYLFSRLSNDIFITRFYNFLFTYTFFILGIYLISFATNTRLNLSQVIFLLNLIVISLLFSNIYLLLTLIFYLILFTLSSRRTLNFTTLIYQYRLESMLTISFLSFIFSFYFHLSLLVRRLKGLLEIGGLFYLIDLIFIPQFFIIHKR